jgi:N-methylhydantoinase A/oxoprolinase/acetone carboxylase beta subunit
MSLGTKLPLIGIGAPTHVFLPAVAKALGTECILPEHAEVANALGALKADFSAVVRVEISPDMLSTGVHSYIVHGPLGITCFSSLDQAIADARTVAETAALELARSRGACDPLTVRTHIESHDANSSAGSQIMLGKTIVSEVEMAMDAPSDQTKEA